MKTRIQNVRLVQDGQIRPVTVLIDGEKIAAVLRKTNVLVFSD